MIVEDVVGLVTRGVLLQKLKAVPVDGADEQPAKPVERGLPEAIFDPYGDAVLQLLGGALREGEGNDSPGGNALPK